MKGAPRHFGIGDWKFKGKITGPLPACRCCDAPINKKKIFENDCRTPVDNATLNVMLDNYKDEIYKLGPGDYIIG